MFRRISPAIWATFIFTCALTLLCITRPLQAADQSEAAKASDKPNILFIFADDLSFDAIGANDPQVKTPNLDKLVSRGTMFTHAYNMGAYSPAVCLCSRMMLNSGLWLWKAESLDRKADQLRKQGKWWSILMHNAGYETFMTGKWHTKASSKLSFDHQVHERPGMPNQTPQGYWRPIEGQDDVWHPWDTKYGGYWKGGENWTEVLGDDATDFMHITAKSPKPFFMYLAFNAAHDPRQSPKKYDDMYPWQQIRLPVDFEAVNEFHEAMGLGPATIHALRDEKLCPFPRTPYAIKHLRSEYYALITYMDGQIGRILDELQKTGKADNTYIIFTADQGLSVGHHGLMGKQNMFDESVRVPFIIVGPGIPAGKQIDTRIYLQDAMPTTLQLAGVDKPDFVKFKSLLPLIQGKTTDHYNAIYGAYMHKNQRMVTEGNDKMILYPLAKKILLFDLAKDPHEMHNLADDPAEKPKIHHLFQVLHDLQKQTDDELDLSRYYGKM